MIKLKFIAVFVAGLLVGVVAAGWKFKHFMAQSTVSEGPKLAWRAAEEANWLALLRLNDTNSVIEQLETSIDATVLALTGWDELKEPDEKSRKLRERFLVSVKVYRDIYPPSGSGADRIKSFLATVPGRSPQSTCKGGVCKLDDLHRGVVNVKTNLPSE